MDEHTQFFGDNMVILCSGYEDAAAQETTINPGLGQEAMVIPSKDEVHAFGSSPLSTDYELVSQSPLLAVTGSDLTTSPDFPPPAIGPEPPIPAEGESDRKKRSRFKEDDRQQTGETRRMGACLRCRCQHVRVRRDRARTRRVGADLVQCNPNPSDPDNPRLSCLTCLKVSSTSKKVKHHIPCLRDKLQGVVLFRSGGLGLTKRWQGTKPKDVGDWVDDRVRTIRVTQGICGEPLPLDVRKFRPNEDDVLCRKWKDSSGQQQVEMLEPYALANVDDTAKKFKVYIDEFALLSLLGAVNSADPLVQRTYLMVIEHYRSLPNEVSKVKTSDVHHSSKSFIDTEVIQDKQPGVMEPNRERELMVNMIRLWFAISEWFLTRGAGSQH
jgi:hypothetical protein